MSNPGRQAHINQCVSKPEITYLEDKTSIFFLHNAKKCQKILFRKKYKQKALF